MNKTFWEQNQTSIVTLVIIAGGMLLVVATAQVAVDVPITSFVAVMILGMAGAYYAFMVSVKFYSYLIIAENYRTTTFHPHIQLVYDEGWQATVALVTGGGYNSPGRLLSYPDVESTSKKLLELFVVMDPFMVEEVGNEHFIVIRGHATECNYWEKKALLERPSIKAALGKDIKSVREVRFVLSSTSLHPDTVPDDTILLDEFATVVGTWQREIEGVNVHTEERLDRMLRTIDRARLRRKPPQPPQQSAGPSKEEGKDEQR